MFKKIQLFGASLFLGGALFADAPTGIDPQFEYYEGGSAAAEAEIRSKVVDKFRLIQAGIESQTGKMMRDTHSTGVCLSGHFQFYSRKEPFLKVASFGEPRTKPVAFIRFADANSGVQSNKIRDVRSVSFSLDLNGQRQDFSMNNDPIFTFGNQTDFDNFLAFSIAMKQIKASMDAKYGRHPESKLKQIEKDAEVARETAKFLAVNSKTKAKFDALKDEWVLPGKTEHNIIRPTGNDLVLSVMKTIAIGKSQQNKDVFSYLTENYGSGSAFRFGQSTAAKFLLVRCEGSATQQEGPSSCDSPAPVREKAPKEAADDFLVQRLKDAVDNKPEQFCFELKVQILDAEKMRDQFGRKHRSQEWVEDATLNWNGFGPSKALCYSLGRLTAEKSSVKSDQECDDPQNAFDVNHHSHADLRPLGNINRARAYAEHQSARLRVSKPPVQAHSPATVSHTRTLDQGWDDSGRDAFWFTPQGSYILPYQWFLALKDADSGAALKEAVEQDGFLAAPPSTKNPDALPIGLTQEAEPGEAFAHLRGKGAWLGITCAACHVGAVVQGGTRFIVDGAPGKVDMESFSLRLEKAMAAALASESAFAQFQSKLSLKPSRLEVEQVRERFVARNTRSFFHGADRTKGAIHAGPGRTDAFAVILNEVASRALGVPSNAREGTAPVSFPKIWGAPFLKWIQYSGLSNNAFTRNTGEVLGVFGDVDLNPDSPHFLQTTARLDNLQKLEEQMRHLKAPRWESVFGPFNAQQRKQIERGSEVFHRVASCSKCHGDEKPHGLGEFQDVALVPAGEFQPDYKRNRVYAGTDPLYFINLKKNWFAIDPGRLKGTNVIAELLRRDPAFISKLRFGDDRVVDGKRQRGKIGADFIAGLLKEKKFGDTANGVQLLAQVTLAIGLQYTVEHGISIDPKDPVYQKLTGGALPGTQPTPGVFKAGPLSGVWATAPYLHNGSVRTLRDMLEPAAQREPAFYVGGEDYDQKNGGFVSSGAHLFFANRMGDTNSGHFAFSGAARLDDQQKEDLLMYLKSL